MSRICINPAHAGDVHYRYQMERLCVKSDGRAGSGGGRTTELVNLLDVSRQLRRSPELLLAYLARRTGTTGRCSRKSGVEAHVLKGHFAPDELQRHIGEFCERLVVCPRCGDCGTCVYARAGREGAKKKKKHAAALTMRMSCGACGFDGETVEQDARLAKICEERAPAPGGEWAATAPAAECSAPDAPTRTTKARGDRDGDDADDAQKLAKYKKKLAKAEEKEGADAAAVAGIKKKIEKYETRLRAKTEEQDMGGESPGQKVAKDAKSDDDDVEWFTDVSPDAVEARRIAALGN